jgi:hypothetical protein
LGFCVLQQREHALYYFGEQVEVQNLHALDHFLDPGQQ